MNAPIERPIVMDRRLRRAADRSRLAQRLRAECRGDVLFDAASRGRYATDASIYQILPMGVVVPRDEDDATIALAVARDLNVPAPPPGPGSPPCGQTVGDPLLVDHRNSLNPILA